MVSLDNLSTHKGEGVQEAIASAGARLEYLPPYSPDFNPIENLWSKVKQGLKSRAPRTARQLFKAAGAPFNTVTPEDCHGFFYMPDTLHNKWKRFRRSRTQTGCR